MFHDRKDAGCKLAQALEKLRGPDLLVLAIPRGGVEVGVEVARGLGAEFSVLVSRKLPFPFEPEAGFGAVAEDGTMVVQPDAGQWLTPSEIEKIRQEQVAEIKRRVQLFRAGRPLPRIEGRTIVLIDDGLAMGSTMKAAVGLCRRRNAGRIVVAVPVAGKRATAELSQAADEVIVLEKPAHFTAVAQAYKRWHDVSDSEALSLLRSWRPRAPGTEVPPEAQGKKPDPRSR